MKKILSLLTVLALLLTLCGTALAEPESELPRVGELVEGFTVKDVRDFPQVGGTAVLLEHDLTGALLLYIANSDINRVFDMTFFTRAIDNTGLPHVFEHATLNGSEKYPSTALFFNLMNQTYNSFMNALTYPLMTSYPVASLSEAQLLRYADFYVDSCLHPSILTDESIFREEAWRYRLMDRDDALSIEGTVYSEMLGAITLQQAASVNHLRSAFPGSTIGNISGGDPEFIPDMTWESLKAYHDLYYHPSNCLALLYGQFEDYRAFLKLLNEAFLPYEKQSFSFEDPDYVPIEEAVTEFFSFPTEADSSTENRSSVYYGFVCSGLREDPQEEMLLNTLTDFLNADASPLMQALKKALPAGSFSAYLEPTGPEDEVVILASNVNPEDAETFRNCVDAVLSDIAEKGFSEELADGIANSLQLNIKLLREERDVGVNLLLNLAYCYAYSGDPFEYMDYMDALDRMGEWNADGLYRETVRTWLLQNDRRVLVTTCPEPGLREQLDAEEAARLSAVKASMSEEELDALIAQSNAEKETDDASAYVAQLQAVQVDSLPEEVREYRITDETGSDGVRRLSAEADVDGIGQPMLLLDASGLPQEDLHWFALYCDLLGELPSSVHSREELAELSTRYLYNGTLGMAMVSRYGTDDFTPYLRARWISADNDLEEGYRLVEELLFDTSFDDLQAVGDRIQQSRTSLKASVIAQSYNTMLVRMLSAESPMYAFYNSFTGLDYYFFLEEAEQLLQTSPETVREKLLSVQEFFHNRNGAVSAFAGNAESIAINRTLADAFLEQLDDRPTEATAWVFELPAESEALIVDSNVQFNGVVGSYPAMGLTGYSADLDAVAALVTDLYLFPMLREQYGVYTPIHYFDETFGTYLITYRDPNILETFEVYDALPDYLAQLEIDQETLDGYILSSYSSYAMPEGELSGALTSLNARLREQPEDWKISRMEALKALTPEKLSEYAAAYAALMENGRRFTTGGAGAINACADLYDQILNPFGAVDSTQVEMLDVTEESEYYEAVRYVFENGLMPMLDEQYFGVEKEACVGDLAAALYTLLGGAASSQEESLDALVSYGLFPAGRSAGEPLTQTASAEILSGFSQALGLEGLFTPEALSEDVLTRGALAQQLSDLVQTLEAMQEQAA